MSGRIATTPPLSATHSTGVIVSATRWISSCGSTPALCVPDSTQVTCPRLRPRNRDGVKSTTDGFHLKPIEDVLGDRVALV